MFNNTKEFIDHYVTFLQINTLLYHPTTCPYTEPTSLYPALIQDLLFYLDTMNSTEKNFIEEHHQEFGSIETMQHFLHEQYNRLDLFNDIELKE